MLKLINYLFFVLTLCFSLSACQQAISVNQDWQSNICQQNLNQDPLIQKSNAPVWIMPTNAPQQPLKAVFFPFALQKKYNNRDRISKQLSKIFYKAWLGQRVFPALEFMDTHFGKDKQAALIQAKALNADIFISGKITDFMSGGSQGTTKIALILDIYTVPKGELIWSMEHSGRIENSYKKDYILFKVHTQMPSSPEYVLVNALAYDLAQPVKKWNHGQPWCNDSPVAKKPSLKSNKSSR